MDRRHAASLAGAFVLGALGMAIADQAARAAAPAPTPSPDTMRWLGVFGSVLDIAEHKYLRPVDEPKAIQAAIGGMLRSLDPHSDYLPPDTFAQMAGRAPSRAVIGITLTESSRGLRIVSAQPNGPAARADIRPGDELVAIDGIFTSNLSVDQAVNLLRGEPASKVVVSLRRDDRLFDLALDREVVPAGPVLSSRMIGDVGYLSISALNEKAAKQAEAAIAGLRTQNRAMKGFVLDLRNCPGGLLDEAAGVADLFMEGGDIFTQRGREPREVERYMARPGDVLQRLPLVVLINGGTASGAEIVAGALQDHGRAKLVGLHSFGNGVIQTVIPLNGGRDGAVKITTSMFFLPSGRPIQKIGLTPDLAVANSAGDAEPRVLAGEASLPGALEAPNAPPAPPRRQAEGPPAGHPASGDYQLERAIGLLTGS